MEIIFLMKKTLIFLGVAAIFVIGGFYFFGEKGKFFASVFDAQKKFAILKTNFGDIKIELLHEDAPNLAENFVKLAENKKYDGTIFHRVIENFMIQGGDFENFNGTGGTSWKNKNLSDEFSPKLTHERGAVSMANKGPNTNGSQFFIVQKDSKFLDGKHSIFGKVTSGMEVVDKIAKVKTDLNDSPLERVIIQKVILQ